MQNYFKTILQTHLDLNFRTNQGLKVQIAEFPGRWMEQEAIKALANDLRTVASSTVTAGELNYGVFSDEAERLKHTIITIVKQSDGTPIAFNALPVIEADINGRETKVLHLGLVMVGAGQRGKGLSWILYGLTCFLLFLRNGLRPIHVSNVTQVPAVTGLVAETFSNVFPTPSAKENSDFRKLLLARSIMSDHRHVFGVGPEASFNEDCFVITNAYTGGSYHLKKTYKESAKHRIEKYNLFCKQALDYDRGDDIFQLGRMDLAAASTYVIRSVPKGSILSVMALGLVIAIQRVVLPVSCWFDADKDFGCLRSR